MDKPRPAPLLSSLSKQYVWIHSTQQEHLKTIMSETIDQKDPFYSVRVQYVNILHKKVKDTVRINMLNALSAVTRTELTRSMRGYFCPDDIRTSGFVTVRY